MEYSAKISVFPIDQIINRYQEENARINKDLEGVEIQVGVSAKYEDEFEIERNKIEQD